MSTVKYSNILEHVKGLESKIENNDGNVKLTIMLPMADGRFEVHQELEINMKVKNDDAEITSVFLIVNNLKKEVGVDLITDWIEI